MKCRFCGHDNPSGEKFCVSCGTPIVYPLGTEMSDEIKEDIPDRPTDINEDDAVEVAEHEPVKFDEVGSKADAVEGVSDSDKPVVDAIEPEDSDAVLLKEDDVKGEEAEEKDDEEKFTSSPDDDPRKKQSDKRKRKKLKREREREARKADSISEESEKKQVHSIKDESIRNEDKKEKIQPADAQPEDATEEKAADAIKLSDTVQRSRDESGDDRSEALNKEDEPMAAEEPVNEKDLKVEVEEESIEEPKKETETYTGAETSEKKSSRTVAIVVVIVILWILYKVLK